QRTGAPPRFSFLGGAFSCREYLTPLRPWVRSLTSFDSADIREAGSGLIRRTWGGRGRASGSGSGTDSVDIWETGSWADCGQSEGLAPKPGPSLIAGDNRRRRPGIDSADIWEAGLGDRLGGHPGDIREGKRKGP